MTFEKAWRPQFSPKCTASISKYCIIVANFYIDDTEKKREEYKDYICSACLVIQEELL